LTSVILRLTLSKISGAEMKKCSIYLGKYRTPKRALAEIIGVNETSLHFYLEAGKYRDKNVSNSVLRKIAAFERSSVARIRAEYEARKAAA